MAAARPKVDWRFVFHQTKKGFLNVALAGALVGFALSASKQKATYESELEEKGRIIDGLTNDLKKSSEESASLKALLKEVPSQHLSSALKGKVSAATEGFSADVNLPPKVAEPGPGMKYCVSVSLINPQRTRRRWFGEPLLLYLFAKNYAIYLPWLG